MVWPVASYLQSLQRRVDNIQVHAKLAIKLIKCNYYCYFSSFFPVLFKRANESNITRHRLNDLYVNEIQVPSIVVVQSFFYV